ncbi:MAG: competence protein ComEC [Psychromonas sp.]|jgi:competence protein ComEC|uniref:DNA internalization-related competence protein ComEC/Rec2 n=1 Tax=Psychromonas sp. TaxID=1884585 RepID=UPI0039E6EFD9
MTMRLLVWLSIIVFISSLFWPRLLDNNEIIFCSALFIGLMLIPRLRIVAVVPFIAVYFSLYTCLALTGSFFAFQPVTNFPFANSAPLQALVDGRNHSIVVQIKSLISDQNKGYFRAKLVELDGHHLNYAPLLEMRWYAPTLKVQENEKHLFKVRFKPVYGRANPAGFDQQKYKYSEHVAYQAVIKSHIKDQSSAFSLRVYLYERVSNLSNSLNNQGAILALSFADKSLITAAQKVLIQQLGISHLFAISGLHISLLFSCVYLCVAYFTERFFPKKYLGWFSWRFVSLSALLGAFLYAYLAGFSLPTQRAFLMLLFSVAILSMKRKCSLIDLLSLTLLAILLWDPLSLLSLSLWLSYIAVCLILIVLWHFPQFNHREAKNIEILGFTKIIHYFKFLVLIQFSLSLLMLPVQLLSFSSFSMLAPFINLLAVPLFSLLIIPITLTAVVFSVVYQPIALLLFTIADRLISYFFSAFEPATFAYLTFSYDQGSLFIFFVGLILVLYVLFKLQHVNARLSYFFTFILLTSLILLLWTEKQHKPHQWQVEVIDIGQGLSILVTSQGQSLLYDTGPRYPSGFTTAAVETLPYLRSIGINSLDYLLVSHSDIDHAGGVDVINNAFLPEYILLGEPLAPSALKNKKTLLCRAGMKWSLGALSVKVLSPLTAGTNNNNNSCVLRIDDGNYSLLLTGDIEKKQELKLVAKYGQALKSTLLLAPHHGSKYSSSETFIKTVAPQWVIFSAGFMNQWGFPATQVKLRYQDQNVRMVNSGLNGFIRFKITTENIIMQTYREDLAPYWYHHSFSL